MQYRDPDGAAGPVYDRMAAGQDPWGWPLPQPPRSRTWNPRSPMWWHRSPGHRLTCIFGAILLTAVGAWFQMFIFALVVVELSGGVQ